MTMEPIQARPEKPEDRSEEEQRNQHIRVKNRRKTYLDKNPDYFSASLELADPLLYDRMIRRFQSPAEREAEGRKKGYSGVLEADLMRSEAKLAALATSAGTHQRSPGRGGVGGEMYVEDPRDVPESKEEGRLRWRREMTERFLRGDDDDFDYLGVDENETWDDRVLEEREAEERWFTEEEPRWILDDDEETPDDSGGGGGGGCGEEEEGEEERRGSHTDGRPRRRKAQGETGIQDF